MKCQGIAGWLFGHDYEPIYDTEIKSNVNTEMIKELNETISLVAWATDYISALEQLQSKTEKYICHMCHRCGDKIERKDK
jgi:hypothetical protein